MLNDPIPEIYMLKANYLLRIIKISIYVQADLVCVCVCVCVCVRAALYHTLNEQHILHIEGIWQSCLDKVYWQPFTNTICSLPVSVSHFDNS